MYKGRGNGRNHEPFCRLISRFRLMTHSPVRCYVAAVASTTLVSSILQSHTASPKVHTVTTTPRPRLPDPPRFHHPNVYYTLH